MGGRGGVGEGESDEDLADGEEGATEEDLSDSSYEGCVRERYTHTPLHPHTHIHTHTFTHTRTYVHA